MTRTFLHAFEPAAASPVSGSTVALDVEEIESAGLKEVLQTPGAALGSWAVLDSLLHPTGPGTPFLFKQPLGQAREVKVALSGLFGRFVARAYLERYLGLAIFNHLGRGALLLDGRRRIEVRRRAPGDLPDWLACAADLSNLTVAEAKGCHDAAGPNAALARAWNQAHRIDVVAQGRRLTVKRVAIATRWGSALGGAPNACLSVRDPVDEGDEVAATDKAATHLGLLRLHVASLLEPLGHPALAKDLRTLAMSSVSGPRAAAQARARNALTDSDANGGMDLIGEVTDADLIGGVVTRAGPLATTSLSSADRRTLERLDLRPTYVGIERRVVKAALEDDPGPVRLATASRRPASDRGRADPAGTWIVRLDADTRREDG